MISIVREQVLKDRLQELDWTVYRLAKELAGLRKKGTPGSYTSAVNRAVDNPNSASLKTFEELVEAMGGEVIVRWPKTQTVVKGYKEVK